MSRCLVFKAVIISLLLFLFLDVQAETFKWEITKKEYSSYFAASKYPLPFVVNNDYVYLLLIKNKAVMRLKLRPDDNTKKRMFSFSSDFVNGIYDLDLYKNMPIIYSFENKSLYTFNKHMELLQLCVVNLSEEFQRYSQISIGNKFVLLNHIEYVYPSVLINWKGDKVKYLNERYSVAKTSDILYRKEGDTVYYDSNQTFKIGRRGKVLDILKNKTLIAYDGMNKFLIKKNGSVNSFVVDDIMSNSVSWFYDNFSLWTLKVDRTGIILKKAVVPVKYR